MMGEGLRCRHIRSKPSELGQKVGNKSDKARGGGWSRSCMAGHSGTIVTIVTSRSVSWLL